MLEPEVQISSHVMLITLLRIPSGGIGTFGPLIVQSFGFDKFKTILFNIPFGAVNSESSPQFPIPLESRPGYLLPTHVPDQSWYSKLFVKEQY